MTDYLHRIADIISEYGAGVEAMMNEIMTVWVSGIDTHTEGADA